MTPDPPRAPFPGEDDAREDGRLAEARFAPILEAVAADPRLAQVVRRVARAAAADVRLAGSPELRRRKLDALDPWTVNVLRLPRIGTATAAAYAEALRAARKPGSVDFSQGGLDKSKDILHNPQDGFRSSQ